MSWVLLGPIAVIVVALALWSLRNVPVLQYAFFLRFQLILTALLVGFPALALLVAADMLENLLVIESWPELAVVVWLALLLAWVVMVTSLITLRRAPDRFEINSLPCRWLDRLQRFRVPAFGLLAVPMIGAATWLSWTSVATRSGVVSVFAALVVGVGGAFISLLAATNLQQWMRHPPEPSQRVDPVEDDFLLKPDRWVLQRLRDKDPRLDRAIPAWFRRLLGPGCIDKGEGRFLSGVGLAIGLSSVSFLIYWAGYFLLKPPDSALRMAALGYVLILVIALGWLLTGAAFYLDRWRVPVVIGLAAYSFVLFSVKSTDHYFGFVENRNGRPLEPLSPEAVLDGWLAAAPSGTRPVMVVVAAAGGGIQAAAWTARVLSGLEAEIPGFTRRHVRLISSVSGGSVGAMYYVDALGQDGVSAATLPEIVRRAGHSCLGAVAWGLVYPDLQRALSPLPQAKTIDRASTMEGAWGRLLVSSGANGHIPTLGDWQAGIREGWRPATVFNATIVDTGRRLLLSPVGIPRAPGADHLVSLYGGRDMSVVTAARLSATFPYVTPVARAVPAARGRSAPYYVADGGYYDNFGVATALDWVREVVKAEYIRRIGGVLLIQIQLEPEPAVAPDHYRDTQHSWLYATFGPALAITSVRTATQLARNEVEITALKQQLRDDACFESIVLSPGVPGPLSWHLSSAQRDSVDRAWKENTKVRAAVDRIREWVGKPDPCQTASADGGGARRRSTDVDVALR
jgi:hypothetical protein